MSQHVIRCRDTGRPLADKLDGGTCVCPPGECRMAEEWRKEETKSDAKEDDRA